jgi:hypothetical protein
MPSTSIVYPHLVDADPDSTYLLSPGIESGLCFLFDPDPTFTLMRIRIQMLAFK